MALRYWVEFFDELQNVRGRSVNTVLAYRRDLELFEEYSRTGKSISGFYVFMKEKKLSDRSQARVVSSLRTYFKFCQKKSGTDVGELAELRPPKVKAKLPQVLTQNEFDKLGDASRVEDVFRAGRNHLTLILLFGLGVRVSELISLNIHDFSESQGFLSVTGKGGKQRLLPLTEYLLAELKSYLLQIRPHLIKDKTDSILINDRGHRPSRVDIWRWLERWSRVAGFSETINPHRFRHGCAEKRTATVLHA